MCRILPLCESNEDETVALKGTFHVKKVLQHEPKHNSIAIQRKASGERFLVLFFRL